MKFISLHKKNINIVYKNSLCSYATVVILVFIISSVMIPVLLVSLLSPYSGISLTRILYEQPRAQFKYQHIFVAETDFLKNDGDEEDLKENSLIACSTFPNFNERFSEYTKSCASAKYWTTDLDHDSNIDIAHFELNLDSQSNYNIKSFDLVVFFEAKLKHKCELNPPALLSHHLIIPNNEAMHMKSGTIHIKAELQLKQYNEFTCPFPGRNIKTKFRDIAIGINDTNEDDMKQYEFQTILDQLKSNPGYFQLNIENIYFRRDLASDLRIRLDVDIVQVGARYSLSVWERLGQFWLYFASFFGISFYIMNKIKDFLFGHHIIRSWEIIPWKKLY